MFKTFKIKTVAMTSTLFVAVFALFTSSALAAYNQAYLISDAIFSTNSGNMNAGSIQAFLASKGGGIAGYSDFELCGSQTGAHFSYYNQYYGCNVSNGDGTWRTNPKPASQIIYDVSQAYQINPEVILATMQKEESLVTTPNPTLSQVTHAMGYGCPDSGGCTTTGFFNQVDNATWQFRFDYQRLTGNSTWWNPNLAYPCSGATRYYNKGLLTGNNVTFMDNNNVAYTTLNLSNASTALLYCYTPHAYNNPTGAYGLPAYGTTGQYFSGSYNFVSYFEQWFGSTGDGSCEGTPTPLPYVQRYYNPHTYEHFYSAYACDANFLYLLGYVNEGPVFNTTSNGLATPVYRYYNAGTGEHMWSTTLQTDSQLAAQNTGYQQDAGGLPVFYVDSSNDPNSTAVYQFYNPKTYLHFWASSNGLTAADLGNVANAGYYLEGSTFHTQN